MRNPIARAVFNPSGSGDRRHFSSGRRRYYSLCAGPGTSKGKARAPSPTIETLPDPESGSPPGPLLPAQGPILELESSFSGPQPVRDPLPHLRQPRPLEEQNREVTDASELRCVDSRSESAAPSLNYLVEYTPSPARPNALTTEEERVPASLDSHPFIFGGLHMLSDILIRDEPIECSNYRYHPTFDPATDYDPLTRYGGVDGILEGRDKAESNITNLEDAIRNFSSLSLANKDLVYYHDGNKAMYFLNKPQLEEITQLVLAVHQVLESFAEFLARATRNRFRFDPGFKFLRSLGWNEHRGDVLLTIAAL
ncbi:hypothetical protein LshimejAT787_2900190 [Lyophyllum shimeji]|uniref:Uncharacterized protein n=1 Tax=Lyophyllum shimeji TaxID=47721 RepID=A0A9P3UX55_LYOSH|nr:hypothetical protein LshimejAT787_2900190 [Lyophyllum shimeji]